MCFNEDAAEVIVPKTALEVKEAAEVNTPDRHPRPLARARERRRERLAQQEAQRWAYALARCDPRNLTGQIDRDTRSHEYQPQEGKCVMCYQDVAWCVC